MSSWTQAGRGALLGCALACLIMATAARAEAQEGVSAEAAAPEPEPMFDRYFHTYNSDFQYFFMRERMRLNKVLTSFSFNQQESGVSDVEVKSFLPVYYGDRFAFLTPFYFYRYPLTPAQQEELPFDAIQNFFWQFVFTADLSDDLTLLVINENHIVGTEESQLSLIGSDTAQFMLLSWEISPQWTVAPAFRAKMFWDDEREANWEFFPAGHVIWRPRDDLSLMTGVPSLLGVEWAGPWQLDVASHVMLGEGNNINVMTAVRKGLGGGFAATVRGLRDGYEGVYVPRFTRTVGGQEIEVNRVSQYKNRVQLELEYHPTDTTMLQLKGGYGFDEGVRLKRDETEVDTIAGEDGFYAGFTLSTFYDMDR